MIVIKHIYFIPVECILFTTYAVSVSSINKYTTSLFLLFKCGFNFLLHQSWKRWPSPKSQTRRGCLEYPSCTPCRGLRSSPKGVLAMTLNCMYWWGSRSEALRSVGYPFIAFTHRFSLNRKVVPVRVSFMGQIDLCELFELDENTWYMTAKPLKKQQHKTCPMNAIS